MERVERKTQPALMNRAGKPLPKGKTAAPWKGSRTNRRDSSSMTEKGRRPAAHRRDHKRKTGRKLPNHRQKTDRKNAMAPAPYCMAPAPRCTAPGQLPPLSPTRQTPYRGHDRDPIAPVIDPLSPTRQYRENNREIYRDSQERDARGNGEEMRRMKKSTAGKAMQKGQRHRGGPDRQQKAERGSGPTSPAEIISCISCRT